MSSPDPSEASLSWAFRMALWGGIAILGIGYAIFIPLKLQGLLSPNMTYLRIIVGLALMASLTPSTIWVSMRFPTRSTLALCILYSVFGAVAFICILVDQAMQTARLGQ